MDQFAATASLENCALLLDCRTLKSEPVPIPRDAAIVVMDTGVRRTLSGSAYNERHAACVRTLNVIRSRHPQVIALRDVDLDMLEQSRESLDKATFKRARHVVEENWRPVQMAEMLRAGDLAKAGELMKASHASLRDLYEVSCKELDQISEQACRHAACFGARMTGAGFGGCAVALVQKREVKSFMADVQAGYQAKVDAPSALFECQPSAGARILE
jgi:galactokinase